MRTVLILAALLAATIAQGGETVFKISKPGYYRYDGTTLVAVTVVDVDGTPVPVPVPVPSDQAKALQAAAEAATADPARAATAANLEAVATLLQQQVEKGTLKDYTAISEAYAYLSEQMVPRSGKAAWAKFQTLVGDHLAALAQEGAKAQAYAVYFGVVADALDASVPQAEKVVSIDMEVLMKLLLFFLEHILPLIIS